MSLNYIMPLKGPYHVMFADCDDDVFDFEPDPTYNYAQKRYRKFPSLLKYIKSPLTLPLA